MNTRVLVLISTSLLGLTCAHAQSTPATKTHPRRTTPSAATQAPATPKNLPPARGPVHTAYALKYIDTLIGSGELAEPDKFYTVNYTGWLASDGTKFDASADHGGPISFPVGAHRVITGWDTGFAGMHIGGKRRLFVPYQLAYGENGRGPIPPKADLIFDIELVSTSDTQPQPTTPSRPTSPPSGYRPPAEPATPTQPSNPPASTAPPASTTPPPIAPSAPAATPPAATPQ